MQLPLRIEAGRDSSLQGQLVGQLRQWIVEGRLRAGARVPPSRRLAIDLGVSRNTVVLAYERLVAEGYFEVRPPVGTFVAASAQGEVTDAAVADDDRAREPTSAQLSARGAARVVFRGATHQLYVPATQAPELDFRVGRPDPRLFPVRSWQEAMRRTAASLSTGQGSYGPPAGSRALREAIVEHVGFARGIRANADQVLITNGSQEGLNILARLFVQEQVPVVVENPCYLGAADVFASYGARLVPVPVDGDGLIVERLPVDAACVYVTPAHQYPTGVMLTSERRARLRAWAEHCASFIIEDDYDSDFFYERAPLPALKAHDPCDQVVYLGTFSKSLGPGLRLGYMILPAVLLEPALGVKALLDNGCGWFEQELLARFLGNGAFAHHLRRIRTAYRLRRDRLICNLRDRFGDVAVQGEQGGMHLLWSMPDSMPLATRVQAAMAAEGVGVYSLSEANAASFGSQATARFARSLVLGYSGLEPQEISAGIERLAKVLGPGAS